jgi:NADH-quinone oxidoreductase subunit C
MDKDQLKSKISSIVPEAVFTENPQFTEFTVPAEKFHELAKQLKENADTAFDYLFDLTATDVAGKLTVVYHLKSTSLNHELVLKVTTDDRISPAVDSVCDIWRGAEFPEREVYDLMGIRFNNHPDLRRIFLEEDWVGHPLRKDYTDEVNIVEL